MFEWASRQGLDAVWVRPPGAPEPSSAAITLNSPSGVARAIRAHVAVGGSNAGIPWPILSEKTWVVQAWHGTPLKTLGSRNPHAKARDSQIRLRADAFISAGPEFTSRMRQCYDIPEDRFWEVGNPRSDRLVLATDDEVGGMRERLRRMTGLEPDAAVLYAPTYRDWQAPIGLLQLPEDQLEQLRAFLARERILLLVRPHDNEAEAVAGRDFGSPWIVSADVLDASWDVSDWLLVADAMVTDYSSIAFDYLVLDRPVIHLVPDLAEYASRRGFLVDPDSDWCGPRVEDGPGFIEALGDAVHHPAAWSDRRRDRNQVFNPMEDGRSTERVAERIGRLIAAGPRRGNRRPR